MIVIKREEKNALSRQRILDAALREFSAKGYRGASLTSLCAESGISKGLLYHYFEDRDGLYLQCVRECFTALTAFLEREAALFHGSEEERLEQYFHARFCFFVEQPLHPGLFIDAAFSPPPELDGRIADIRRPFDELNSRILTDILRSRPLREGLTVAGIVEDFMQYTDFFNLRFYAALQGKETPGTLLAEHDEAARRQIRILFHGVFRE